MKVDWGALGIVAVIALAVSVVVVALVSFALVGLSSRARSTGTVADGTNGAGGSDEERQLMSPAVGTGVAGVCLLAVAAIVVYGLYVIVA